MRACSDSSSRARMSARSSSRSSNPASTAKSSSTSGSSLSLTSLTVTSKEALRRKLAEVELRIADGHDPGGLDRVGVPARERLAHGFLEHHLAADALDDERRGHLPATKAGQLQLTPELLRLLGEAPLELACRDLDLETHARIPELGDFGLDRGRHPRHDTVPIRVDPADARPLQAAGGKDLDR